MKVRPHNIRLDVNVAAEVGYEGQANFGENPFKKLSRGSNQQQRRGFVDKSKGTSFKDDMISAQPQASYFNTNTATIQQQGPRRDTSLIGKTVRILQGPMKGYYGTAKDATDATVRVELHAQPKVNRIRVLLNY
jgi:hypothetical protein